MPDHADRSLRREIGVRIDGLFTKLAPDDRAKLLAFLSLSEEHRHVVARLRINGRGDVFVAVRAGIAPTGIGP